MRRRSAAGRSQQLLCVDDDVAARQFYKRILEGYGFRVLLAENGANALRLLRQHRVALIVSDHDMPGMNGAELARQVHRRRTNIPFLLLSGRIAVVDNPPQGVDVALLKGIPLDRLIEAIDKLREKARSRRTGFETLRPLLPLGEALAGVAIAAFVVPRLLK